MQGIYYLAALAGLLVIVAWTLTNDRLKPGERTRGLLRMERDLPEASAREQRPEAHPGRARQRGIR